MGIALSGVGNGKFCPSAKFLGLRAGDVLHLYHGSRPHRQYLERYKILHENAFDPGRDVEIDAGTGLLQWSETAQRRKPDLVRRVAAYSAGRREDE